MSNSFDVDIAHIRARTLIAVVLAVGAVVQTVCGALLLNAGLNPQGIPSLKMMGVDVSTSTLGAVTLCTSALWAYVAYLARPQSPARETLKPAAARQEGSIEIHDFTLSPPASDPARVSN